jgi:hypothetical protein
MIDRRVSDDGGNPDPTTTHDKKVMEAKAIAVQKETQNMARAVVQAMKRLSVGALSQPDKKVVWPRPK